MREFPSFATHSGMLLFSLQCFACSASAAGAAIATHPLPKQVQVQAVAGLLMIQLNIVLANTLRQRAQFNAHKTTVRMAIWQCSIAVCLSRNCVLLAYGKCLGHVCCRQKLQPGMQHVIKTVCAVFMPVPTFGSNCSGHCCVI